MATTQLTPSGKARFEGELVDVIADGEVDRPRRRRGGRRSARQSGGGPLGRGPRVASLVRQNSTPKLEATGGLSDSKVTLGSFSTAYPWIRWFGPCCCCSLGLALVSLEVFLPSGGILGFLSIASLLAGIVLAFYHRGPKSG